MTDVARPGQPLQIRADDWNDATAAGAAVAAARQSQRLEIIDPRTRAPDLLRVRNSTEEAFERWDVVELTTPVIPPAESVRGWHDGLPALEAVTPTSPAAAIRGRLAILTEPIPAGKIGLAIASAVCRTRLTLCDSSHTHAAPIAGTRRLQSTADTAAPIEILWADEPAEPEGEEEQDLTVDALVRISNAHEPLTAFRLTARAESLDDFPKAATRIDADGNAYGEAIEVRTPEILQRIYGPADEGFQGWAVYKPVDPGEGDPCESGHWQIVHMQRFAQYIKFSGADFSGGCLAVAEADSYWHGEEPTWGIKVDASHLLCTCLGSDTTGIAVLDEKQSAYPWLIYRVIDVDQMLYTADAADCDANPCDSGQATRVLIAGDGLDLEYFECGAVPCAAVLHWAGLEVVGMECESEEDPGTGTKIAKLATEAPLSIETVAGCPALGILKLTGGLIEADNTDECITLTVTESQCKYTLTVTLNRDCLAGLVTVLAGTCISVDQGEDESGNATYTINNTMDVVGGNGISVQKNGCTYSVNLDGNNADPKTTLRILCGVEISPIQISCTQDYEGNWGFTVSGGELTEHFTTLEIPAALIQASSDCGDDGLPPPDPPDPPVHECDDCPDCAEGETKIMEAGTGDCNCIDDTAAMPEGWIECPSPDTPSGEGIEILGMDCNSVPAHFSYAVRGIPAGATNYTIHVQGDQGSQCTVGPSFDHEEIIDQERWGALEDGFGSPQPGENFSFAIEWRDEAGNLVAKQVLTASCDAPAT